MSLLDAFKKDIAHVGDIVKVAPGDIGTIQGLANLKEALFHRLITVPGTLVHRPTYGVGIPSFQNRLSSFAVQQRLSSIIQEQYKQDPRVEDVKSVSIQAEDSDPQKTIITIVVFPVGYSEVTLKFQPFVGGGL